MNYPVHRNQNDNLIVIPL